MPHTHTHYSFSFFFFSVPFFVSFFLYFYIFFLPFSIIHTHATHTRTHTHTHRHGCSSWTESSIACSWLPCHTPPLEHRPVHVSGHFTVHFRCPIRFVFLNVFFFPRFFLPLPINSSRPSHTHTHTHTHTHWHICRAGRDSGRDERRVGQCAQCPRAVARLIRH